ncbi:hypothetical protein CEXT_453981 [Caerostris extrusa]|uniref:Secreted protein n=1 Tax=Caerostris extrusa TaxID=172846 RepID=A0AAV4SFN7_CAEEX|nr:hypothetical protein CEXT_453981 [Caerostris extrusa]
MMSLSFCRHLMEWGGPLGNATARTVGRNARRKMPNALFLCVPKMESAFWWVSLGREFSIRFIASLRMSLRRRGAQSILKLFCIIQRHLNFFAFSVLRKFSCFRTGYSFIKE